MNDLLDPSVDDSDDEPQLSGSVRRHLAALAKSLETAERDALTPQGVDSLAVKVANEARRFSHNDKVQFVQALYEHHNVHRACLATGISRRGALHVRGKDQLFADAWAEALQSHVDDIEDHLMAQAKTSKAPLWAIFALKAHRPDLYGDRIKVDQTLETEVTVILGGGVQRQDAVGSPSANDSAPQEERFSPRGALTPGREAQRAGADGCTVDAAGPEPHPATGKEPLQPSARQAGRQARGAGPPVVAIVSTHVDHEYLDAEDP